METKYMPVKGDFFTIVKWIPIGGRCDRSWVGACLEARVVDGQFIRTRNHHSKTHKDNFTLNADELELRQLSPEFVAEHTEDAP